MKLLLCMMIVAASLAIGLYLNSRLTERTKILSSYITMLEEAAVRMSYTSDHLAALFADNFAGFVFDEHQPFAEQFCHMTRRYKDVLTEEDIRVLDDFTRDLGVSDTASQLKHIRLSVTLLTQHLESAREEVRKKSKVRLILPLSVGLAAAILLL